MSREHELVALRGAVRDGKIQISGQDPAAVAGATAILKNAVRPDAPTRYGRATPGRGVPTVTQGMPSYVATPAGADQRAVGLVSPFLGTRRIPIWLWDPTDLSHVTIPSDPFAETNMLTVMSMYGLAGAMAPYGALTASASGVATATLSASGTDKPILVAGLLVELSLVENTSTLANWAFKITGYYYNRVPKLLASISAGANPYDTDATPDFDSGIAVFQPLGKARKAAVIVTPFKVVNGKTFPSPLVVALAAQYADEALEIKCVVSAAPASGVTEITAITPNHYLFNSLTEKMLTDIHDQY